MAIKKKAPHKKPSKKAIAKQRGNNKLSTGTRGGGPRNPKQK